MKLEQAKTILNEYQVLLNRGPGVAAKRTACLPRKSKQEILNAIQLRIAELYLEGLDDERTLAPLIRSAMCLDSFACDAVKAGGGTDSMEARRREIMEFHRGLLHISRHDRSFWPQVYALAGMDVEVKSSNIFEMVKDKLSRMLLRESGA